MNILRPKEVCKLLSISMTSLYRRINEDPTFPRRIRLGKGRSVGFLESDIKEWLESEPQNKKA